MGNPMQWWERLKIWLGLAELPEPEEDPALEAPPHPEPEPFSPKPPFVIRMASGSFFSSLVGKKAMVSNYENAHRFLSLHDALLMANQSPDFDRAAIVWGGDEGNAIKISSHAPQGWD